MQNFETTSKKNSVSINNIIRNNLKDNKFILNTMSVNEDILINNHSEMNYEKDNINILSIDEINNFLKSKDFINVKDNVSSNASDITHTNLLNNDINSPPEVYNKMIDPKALLGFKNACDFYNKETKDNTSNTNVGNTSSFSQNKFGSSECTSTILKIPFETRKGSRWTKEEDELLTALVEEFEGKSWKKIASFIKSRTPIQCLHRWTKILKPGLVKGPWTSEEDKILINWVKENGATEFTCCNNIIPGRNSKQCRERWFNVLNPKVLKGDWHLTEDYLIYKLYLTFGGKWIRFVPFFKGLRAENSIKNRFYSTIRRFNTLLKKQNKFFDNESQKIVVIFQDLRKKLIDEFKIKSEEELKQFEYEKLGFVDKIEDKDPMNKIYNKEDLIAMASKFYQQKNVKKHKCLEVLKNMNINKIKTENLNIENNRQINKEENNFLRIANFKEYNNNNYNNDQKYIENVLKTNKENNNLYSNDFSVSVSDSLDSNLFTSNFDTNNENETINQNNVMDIYDSSNYNNINNRLKYENNMDYKRLLNQQHHTVNNDKPFNKFSLDDLEDKIMNFCDTQKLNVTEDWNKNINNKFQNVVDMLDSNYNKFCSTNKEFTNEASPNQNNNINYNQNNINYNQNNVKLNHNNNEVMNHRINEHQYIKNPYNYASTSNHHAQLVNPISEMEIPIIKRESQVRSPVTVPVQVPVKVEDNAANSNNIKNFDRLMLQLNELEDLVKITKSQLNKNSTLNTNEAAELDSLNL